jgi:hypothetical protein
MRTTHTILTAGLAATIALASATVFAQGASADAEAAPLVLRSIPDQDPGPPFYARYGLQEFSVDGWLIVVFYRDPACVPDGFDLIEGYHFPSEAGPGAFLCAPTVGGHTLTEPDAPPTRFPWLALLEGNGAVPVWFVPLDAFRELPASEPVTVQALAALQPLVGRASHYHETLHPRSPGHAIEAVAVGVLEDGRAFRYRVSERDGSVTDIALEFH